MDIFGFAPNELIFYIFLPFLFFYLLIYALLRKTEILGKPKEANTLNVFLALVISTLGTFSLYYLGLSYWLPFLAGFIAVSGFIILYFYGIYGRVKERTTSYASGDFFKTEDEKKFGAGVKNCEGDWERFKKEKNPEIKKQLLGRLNSEVAELDQLAKKLGKSLYDYEWYKEIAEYGEKE